MLPSVALSLLLATALSPAAPAEEMRGLWVVRTALVSPRQVDQVVDRAAEAGFNALFVQVRGRGDAFYESRLVPRSPLLSRQAADFDPLARLLGRARARGLEVHGWVNTLLTAHLPLPLPAGHVLGRHPDWAMVPRKGARRAFEARGKKLLAIIRKESREIGDVEGFYLSPSVAGVQAHLEGVIRELLETYELDGLHLDFIRYPGPSFDYSRAALEGFRRHTGGTVQDLLGATRREARAWADYRRDILTSLAVRLGQAARSVRPGVLVSAAVVPDESLAVEHKFQSWPRWVSDGVLDVVCPMVYTTDRQLFQSQVEQARARVGQKVWAGIGAFRLTVEGTIERIRAAREAGAAGVVLFSHESFGPGDLRRLRQEVFSVSGGRGAILGSPAGQRR